MTDNCCPNGLAVDYFIGNEMIVDFMYYGNTFNKYFKYSSLFSLPLWSVLCFSSSYDNYV